MKIFVDGAKFYAGQADRIEAGFVALGHEITPYVSEADLLFINDEPHYDQIIADRKAGRLKGNVIFNVLDVPTFLTDYSVNDLRDKLMNADAVTAISKFTQQEVKKYCMIEPAIVYNPIKTVYRDESWLGVKDQYRIRYLSVGRRSDKNKRSNVWAQALQTLDVDPREVGLVGAEPGWGNYIGVLDDRSLSYVYASVDFVLATGQWEGLNLPMCEAMACGAIPIICADLSTREEFLPSDLFPEYLDVAPDALSVAKFVARYLNSPEAMAEMKERLYQHYQKNWADKLSGEGVARAIINVYKTLCPRTTSSLS